MTRRLLRIRLAAGYDIVAGSRLLAARIREARRLRSLAYRFNERNLRRGWKAA